MSTRRQARAAQLAGVVDIGGTGVPPELLDPRHRTWRSDYATAAWFDFHGLTWGTQDRDTVGQFWPRRYQAAMRAWAMANGLFDSWDRPDVKRLRELGITTTGFGSLCRLALQEGGIIAEV